MSHTDDRYYIPHGSHWPAVGSLGLLMLMVGVSTWLNGSETGFWIMLAGFGTIIFMLTGWFGTVISESQRGIYNDQVSISFRMGMFWFIFSEVMFFAAFFGTLFYARNMSIPWLGGDSNSFFTNILPWPEYESTWPTNGPGNVGGDYEAMGPFGLPLINTALLLTSSVTLTIAHHALIAGKRGVLKTFLAATFLLGFFLDWIEISLIILPLVAPVIQGLGFDLIWFTVMFAVCLQTSFLTPPVGFAIFYLKGVAPPSVELGHLYRGIVPFVILQLVGLALLFSFPALATWLPSVAY